MSQRNPIAIVGATIAILVRLPPQQLKLAISGGPEPKPRAAGVYARL